MSPKKRLKQRNGMVNIARYISFAESIQTWEHVFITQLHITYRAQLLILGNRYILTTCVRY